MNNSYKIQNYFQGPILQLFRYICSKQFLYSKVTRNISSIQRPIAKSRHFIYSLPSIWISKLMTETNNNTTTLNTNSDELRTKISNLVERSKAMLNMGNYTEAKNYLYEALKVIEACGDYEHVGSVYDLLVGIAITEGNIGEAEEMLVRFIEKLLQIGYEEDHNQIVRYKLKLCRLYQIIGNTEMAEIGYRSCVNVQEKKLRIEEATSTSNYDQITHMLYMSSLFWYGRFLTQGNDLVKAKVCMEKALKHEKVHPVLQPTQLMVVLYHTAEISFKLHEYQDSVTYLVEAIELCLSRTPNSEDLPIFVVKLGTVFLFMQLYEQSKYWCEKGLAMARQHGNEMVEEEATACLQKLREFNGSIQKKEKTSNKNLSTIKIF